MSDLTAIKPEEYPTVQRPRTSVWLGIVVLNGILITHLLVIISRGLLEFAPDVTLQVAVSLGVAAGCALIALWRARAHTPLVLSNRAHNLYTFGVLGFLLTVGLTPVPPDVRSHLLHTHILLTFALSSVVIYSGLFETTTAPAPSAALVHRRVHPHHPCDARPPVWAVCLPRRRNSG